MAAQNKEDRSYEPPLKRLLQALCDVEIAKQLKEAIASSRERHTVPDDVSEDGLDYWSQLERLNADTEAINELKDTTEARLRSTFDNFSPITFIDFSEALFHQLGGADLGDEHWNIRYLRGLTFVLNALRPVYEADILATGLSLGAFADPPDAPNFEFDTVWQHQDFLRLLMSTEEVKDRIFAGEHATEVELSLQGWASRSASDRIERQLKAWCGTVGAVIRASALPEERLAAQRDPYLPEDWAEESYDGSVPISHLFSPDTHDVIKTCFGVVAKMPRLETTLEKRLVNALTLFREADRQELPAVGLTLCFSAIEAIVATTRSPSPIRS